MRHVPSTVQRSVREQAWREAVEDAEARVLARLDQVTEALAVRAGVRKALAVAGLEIARQFAAECTYANYRHRTGMPWPEEARGLEEEERETAWRLALERLQRAQEAS